jgi:hypothetical protein
MDLKYFEKEFQFLIIAGLKHSRARVAKGRIAIKKTVYDKLKDQGVTGHYKTNPEIMENYTLERMVTRNGDIMFTTIEDVFLKLGKPKKIKINDLQMSSNVCSFSFKFQKHFTN